MSLAAMLAVGALFSWGVPGVRSAGPIGGELAGKNPAAVFVLAALAAMLGYFWWRCGRVGWRGLSWSAAGIALLIPMMAFTSPESRLHLAAFVSLLASGTVWLVVYAAKDCQRLVSSLTILLIVTGATIGFLAAGRGLNFDVAALSPLGFFRIGFLLVFAVLAMRRPSHPVPVPLPEPGSTE